MQYSDKEKEIIERGLKQYGKRAYKDTKSKGLPVIRLHGNNILEECSDKVNVVLKLPQTKYKIKQRTFKLNLQ